jgi:hypothetical protein
VLVHKDNVNKNNLSFINRKLELVHRANNLELQAKCIMTSIHGHQTHIVTLVDLICI